MRVRWGDGEKFECLMSERVSAWKPTHKRRDVRQEFQKKVFPRGLKEIQIRSTEEALPSRGHGVVRHDGGVGPPSWGVL